MSKHALVLVAVLLLDNSAKPNWRACFMMLDSPALSPEGSLLVTLKRAVFRCDYTTFSPGNLGSKALWLPFLKSQSLIPKIRAICE